MRDEGRRKKWRERKVYEDRGNVKGEKWKTEPSTSEERKLKVETLEHSIMEEETGASTETNSLIFPDNFSLSRNSNVQQTGSQPVSDCEGSDSEGTLNPRKIRHFNNPALKLKTPIAYHNVKDPDMIPIKREGRAVCENCGAIGVKHSFYTKERRYCSQACAKAAQDATLVNSSANVQVKTSQCKIEDSAVADMQAAQRQPVSASTSRKPGAVFSKKFAQPLEEVHIYFNKIRLQSNVQNRKKAEEKYGFNWADIIDEPGFVTPSVTSFKHVALSESWASDVTVELKVEVENTDVRPELRNGDVQSYWVATIMAIEGYKAQLRYEGFGEDNAKDFWVNMGAKDVHPIGWCASKGKPLIPPTSIQDKFTDWRDFLVKRLTGARSLNNQLHPRIIEGFRSRFRVGVIVELVDRTKISQVKVARIGLIVGRRLRLHYLDEDENQPGFWCHEDSPLIHPVGWAETVGHPISAPQSYVDRCRQKLFEPNDATPDLFMEPNNQSSYGEFTEGMKLEAVDPLNLSSICVATVVKVLRHGYLMVQMDTWETDSDSSGESDSFCYHASSSCVAPPGFCEMNGISLTPPRGYGKPFRWKDYLKETNSVAATKNLFPKDLPDHGFRQGMRIEATDLMDSRLICVARIAQVAGRLVRVHFDGWEDEFDQWMDAHSAEIYPVGWCELAGYRLEPPRSNASLSNVKTPARKSKKSAKNHQRRTRSLPAETADEKSEKRRRGRPKKPDLATGRALRPRKRALSEEEDNLSEREEKTPRREDSTNRLLRSRRQSISQSTSPGVSGNVAPSGTVATAVPTTVVTPAATTATALPTSATGQFVPRIIDVPTAKRKEVMAGVKPLEWNVFDVASFLRVNSCAAYCDAFFKAKVDGQALLALTKDELLILTANKLGPSLKIEELISSLKSYIGLPPNRRLNS